MSPKDIIQQMPPDIRKRAEEKAARSGVSLEQFVQTQISAELSDDDLDTVSGGGDGFDWIDAAPAAHSDE